MGETNIQWTARHRVKPDGECAHGATGEERCWVKGHTVNPWIGCEKVSAACKNCYAEIVAENRMGLDVWGKGKAREIRVEKAMRELLTIYNRAERAGQRTGVFSGSMCDIFEDREELAEPRRMYLERAAVLPGHLDLMLLTKRPENVLRMVPPEWLTDWPSHVWVGATIEDGQTAFARMPHVLTLAGLGATTFLSIEPLLGNIDARAHAFDVVDLVIVGGESGGGARALDMAAAEKLAGDVVDLGTSLFWKQMGSRWAQANPGGLRKGASHGQDPYRWPAWARRREMPVTS